MFAVDSLLLGIGLVLLGILFWGISRGLMILWGQNRRLPQKRLWHPENFNLGAPTESVILISPGGRLASINEPARELFKLSPQDCPSLERIARSLRPGEAFLALCAAEGRAMLSCNGKAFEGSSQALAVDNEAWQLVRLSPVMTETALDDSSASLDRAQPGAQAHPFTSTSLNLEKTVGMVFGRLEKTFPADHFQITLWDGGNEVLLAYVYSGEPREVRRINPPISLIGDELNVSAYIARVREPVFLFDTDRQTVLQVKSLPDAHPRSWMGVPLLIEDDLVGTLEIGSDSVRAFQETDLKRLEDLALQAAPSLRNALLYRKEQRRSAEFSSLAQLSQAIASARDLHGMFARLVESIRPLMEVNVLGFLLYDENRRTIQGQAPFHGLPSQFVEMYRISVAPGSPIAKAILDQDVLITENAAEDPVWEELGFSKVAQAASLHETVLVPMISAGKFLGYLQASNHSSNSHGFSKEELHLLMISGVQAASVLENASLVQEARVRLQRAEGLRQIASLTGSSAPLAVILHDSIHELARLLRADLAATFLLDSRQVLLQLDLDSLTGVTAGSSERARSMDVEDAQFPFTVTGSRHGLISDHLLEEHAIIPFYQSIRAEWGAESLLIVPMIASDRSLGEIWVGSRRPFAFNLNDLHAATTASAQIAGVVEREHLSSQTDEGLRRRLEELSALNHMGREMLSILDLETLLQMIYEGALQLSGASCGTVLLIEPRSMLPASPGALVRVQAGEIHAGVLSPWEREVLMSDRPRLISGAHDQPFESPHPGIASILAVPIINQQDPLGLIYLHSTRPEGFDGETISALQTLSAQAGLGLANLARIEQHHAECQALRDDLDARAYLIQAFQNYPPGHRLDEVLSYIAETLRRATPFQAVLVSQFDEPTASLLRVCGLGIEEGLWDDLRSHSQPWNDIENVLLPEFKYGSVYFIPAEKQQGLFDHLHSVTVLPHEEETDPAHWDADDLLLIPLYASTGKPVALISLDAPFDRCRPRQITYETLNLTAMLAEWMIENHRGQFHKTTGAVPDHPTPQDIETLDAFEKSITLLLQKDMQQTLAIQVLTSQANYNRTVLEIVRQASEQKTTEGVLFVLAREIIAHYHLEMALIAEAHGSGPQLLQTIGKIPAEVNIGAWLGQRNPLRQMLEDRRVILVSDLSQLPEAGESPLLKQVSARCVIGLPLDLGDFGVVGILAMGSQSYPAFSDGEREMLEQVGTQLGVVLQNLKLLDETRRRLDEVNNLLDFNRKLTSLDPVEILHALVNGARRFMPHVHAGWAALWDAREDALVTQAASGYPNSSSLLCIHYRTEKGFEPLPVASFRNGQSVRIDELDFSHDYRLSPDDLLSYRKATGGRLPVSCLAVPIARGDEILGIMILDNFTTSAAFSADDELLALSLSRQTALALESAFLYASAEGHAAQMQALTGIGRTITGNLQHAELVSSLLGQLSTVLLFDTATLWLREGDLLRVAAASGFVDGDLRIGVETHVSDSRLFQEMAANSSPISVPDVSQDVRFLAEACPERLSWLGLPLIAKSNLIGVVALEKRESSYFTKDHVQAGMTFASQAAIALENARLYEESVGRAAELDQRSRRLALLNRLSDQLRGTFDIHHILEWSCHSLRDAVNCSRISVAMVYDQSTCGITYEIPVGENLPTDPLPDSPWLDQLRQSGNIFTTTDVSHESGMEKPLLSYFESRRTKSLLAVPLVSGEALLGWFWLQTEHEYHFTSPEIEMARTISNQVAISIQNARLFAETRSLTAELEQRVEERTSELRREHQKTETLLATITELSAAPDLDQALLKTLSILKDCLDAEQVILIMFGERSPCYRCGKDVAFRSPGQEALSMELEAAQWVLQQKKSICSANAYQETRWRSNQCERPVFHSLMGIPVLSGADALGVLMLFHRAEGKFSPDQFGMLEAAARQIAVTIHKADLYQLTHDQSVKLAEMLREQQIEYSRSRAILESVADGVIVTGQEAQVTLFNPSAGKILGMDPQKMMNQPLSILGEVLGEPVAGWVSTVKSWSTNFGRIDLNEVYTSQVELNREQIIAVQLAPVFWHTEYIGTVTILRDITHDVQIDRMKSEFIANVSHELRTPMTSIKGYVEIMLMGASGEVNEKQRRFLTIIKNNTDRLSILVSDLLEVSRIDAGRVKLDFMAVDALKLIKEIVAEAIYRACSEARQVTFTADLPADLPAIYGDRERLRQVLTHLVTNAYNYTPDGGSVVVSAAARDDSIQIDVKDTGIGIAAEERPRIFERFFRGQKPIVLATAGNGLGLSLAKTLIEMHHGKIWFESPGEPGRGSVFTFTLPACRAEGERWQES